MESLTGDENVRLEIPLSSRETKQYYCPYGEQCADKFSASLLATHVSQSHRTAVISFGDAFAKIALPPRPPIDNANLVLQLDDNQFWIKIKFESDEYFIVALMQNSVTESARYYLEVQVGNMTTEKILSKEIVSRCAVVSLEQKSWKVNLLMYKISSILTTKYPL